MGLVALVTGDRRWDDYGVVAREIDALPQDGIVVTTNIDGLDRWVRECAQRRGLKCLVAMKGTAFPRAGAMIHALKRWRGEGHDVIVVAIHADLAGDRFGHTPQVVRLAALAGITVRLVEG